jgi:hypothetical protein
LLPADSAQARDVAIVSCDIVGHSLDDMQHQLAQIADINNIVASVIDACSEEDVVWASGGDGGHVVFRQLEWHKFAIDLIARLRHWSAEARVPLRVSAHIGPVNDVRGADGRTQLVGDGINMAGWILTRGSAEGVVVSEAFRSAFRPAHHGQHIVFHDSRILRDKSQTGQHLMLMSIGSDHSSWATPADSGTSELSHALARGAGWDVIYFAKRIFQTNTVNPLASQAVKRLHSLQLTYRATSTGSHSEPNPFFQYLEPSALQEIVQLGELVERRYNEAICRYGDEGDTMFVILRGEVGVYKPEEEGNSGPAFTLQEGDIVGELAFALGRNRTADLIALSNDVALLSFNYNDISTRLPVASPGQGVRERVYRFIIGRVLEHICHGASYLLGSERTGPLAIGSPSWRDTLSLLEDDALLISPDRRKLRINFDDVLGETRNSRSAGRGLYILTTGQLRGYAEGVKKVDSDIFPLLWVDIPDVMVTPGFSYKVEAEPVKILYIGAEGLADLPLPKREAIYSALRRAAASCYHFDAFISYNSLDEMTARRWADALRRKGLQIYIDTPTTGAEFPSRITRALLDSRAVIAIVSANVMVRDTDENWVLREARYHQNLFDNPRIFPVCLAGARHEQLFPGFASIDVGKDESSAIERAAAELVRLRDGGDPPSLKSKDEFPIA